MPHIHEKVDYTVEVFVVNGSEVLLRKHDKYKIWLSVGGHIDLDEDPPQAAVREVKEETGLIVKLIGTTPMVPHKKERNRELLVPRFMNRHRINENHEHVSLVYFAIAGGKEVVPGKGEQEVEARWFTLEELSDPAYEIPEDIAYYAKAALRVAETGYNATKLFSE